MSSNDAFDIVSVLNLYALAIDSRQWDLFDRVFTSDAEVSYPGAGSWNDLAKFKKYFAEAHDHFNMSQHFITNHQVVVNGDRANAMSYVQARHSRNIDGSDSFWEMGGCTTIFSCVRPAAGGSRVASAAGIGRTAIALFLPQPACRPSFRRM